MAGNVIRKTRNAISTGTVQQHVNIRPFEPRKFNGDDNMSRKGQEALERAQRFPIHIPVRYRIPRSPDWSVACSENVSWSGVLFRTECIFKPTATLDLRLELPRVNNNGGVRAEVVCKGEVVRVEQTYPAGTSSAVAVAIRQYRLAQMRQPN